LSAKLGGGEKDREYEREGFNHLMI
jgi:hypothetical protein